MPLRCCPLTSLPTVPNDHRLPRAHIPFKKVIMDATHNRLAQFGNIVTHQLLHFVTAQEKMKKKYK